MTPATYYIWKWADNDLPGKPNDVFAALMRGRMHPALQEFDPAALVQLLEATAAGSAREEWTWEVQRNSKTGLARFVIATGPAFPWKIPHTPLTDTVWRLGFVWYHEEMGRVGLGLPKHTCFKYIDLPWVYDATEAELPVLLRQIPTGTANPFAILEDHRCWFVQTFTDGKHWIVEWRENNSVTDWKNFDQWIAGHRPVSNRRTRVKSVVGKGPPCRASERLTYAETLDIFRAFLHGEPRPTRYHWHSIKAELK